MGSPQKQTITLTKKGTPKSPISLPVLEPTLGPKVIDVRKLYTDYGLFTYDPSFISTASCESKITFIDGEKGILLHRGYAIEELAQKSHFLEVAYLLLNGELPNLKELQDFERNITLHTMVHEQLVNFFKGFRRDAHPMSIMVGVVAALSSFYHDSLDIHDPVQREIASFRLIAKMPTITAMTYKYAAGHPFTYPLNELSYSGNFLHMMFALPTQQYAISPILEKAMDRILILHADHEQNASTSTVRLAGSSGANPFACIASGIASLWGPAHGGANEAVLSMLKEIGSKDRIGHYIQKAKDKNDPFRLMGFGHRVYKNYDPRAAVLRQSYYEVLEELDLVKDPFLDLAIHLERIALEDDYFVERQLFPNIDFYAGLILKAMGIPSSMFTVLFSMARTAGWVAQWKEMIEDPIQKIGRPRQLYTGVLQRNYLPLEER